MAEDEAVCLANGAGDVAPQNTDVFWHARRGTNVPADVLQASNL